MKILVAEYASALGMGGTCELEGRAMLFTLVSSFKRCGHDVVYPTSGKKIAYGEPVILNGSESFEDFLLTVDAHAGLLIAPDCMQADLLEILEKRMANLGCSPEAARLCSDKLECTRRLKESGVPVADVVEASQACQMGCRRYVIKPRSGCGSEGVRISSDSRAPEGFIATRYLDGLHLSASFVMGETFLPLTINRQLIEFHGDFIGYNGSQVPYNTPRADEIWGVAENAARAMGLRGYAGIDFVIGDLPRAVDVNARPTTSIIGIARVMKEELGDIILRSRFGGQLPKVSITGSVTFTKEQLGTSVI
jgi:tyramine---L-glutamate ligase